MAATTRPAWQNALITLSAVVTTTVILSLLYIGRVVAIPIAMAIFFTYVLAPVVAFLQRRGIGRMAAVILTVAAAVCLFLGTSFLITQQLASLTQTLTANAEPIKIKVASLQTSILGSTDSPLAKLLDDLDKMIAPAKGDATKILVMEPRQSAWTPSVNTIVGPATEAFGQAAFSFILVVFMLLSKTDLGDRLLRLLGEDQMTTTTRAMNDASERVSNYLFHQFIINSSFGLVVAIALFAIGMKYSLLWGFLITLMRYVPYIGTWLGVIPPAIFAFATSPDFGLALGTVGIVLGLEMFVNNLVEPRIYGKSLGVSEVAQLVSAAIWSFLWGPIGLILSSPITTCLLVLGRHAPPFRFLEVLLGNTPPLSPSQSLFQRLVTKDQDEAMHTLKLAMKDSDPEAVFDEVFLPALVQLKASRLGGELEELDNARILTVAREVLDETLDELREKPSGDEEFVERIRVFACPAQDEFDQLSLEALASRLPIAYWEVRVHSVTKLASEMVTDTEEFNPQVILIGSLPPGGVAHARYLVKRLRQRCPDAQIVMGRWNDTDLNVEEWKAAGCDTAAATLRDALKHLRSWKPVLQAEKAVKA